MNTGILQRLWEENKQFLLIASAALLVFLLFRSCVVYPYARAADQQGNDIQRKENDAQRLLGFVRRPYNEENDLLEKYGELEKELWQRFCVAPAENVAKIGQQGGEEVYFSRQVDQIWSPLVSQARRINCRLPEKISLRELGVSADDTVHDLARHTIYLEVLRRALNVMVQPGVRNIGKAVPRPEDPYSIRGNAGQWEVVFYPVEFRIQATYSAIVEILRASQKSPNFVQVLVMDINPRAGPDHLTAHLSFRGVRIVEAGEGDEE